MIKNIIIIISVAINVILYTGAMDIGQYRAYVDEAKEAISKTSISVNTPAGSFTGSTKGITTEAAKK